MSDDAPDYVAVTVQALSDIREACRRLPGNAHVMKKGVQCAFEILSRALAVHFLDAEATPPTRHAMHGFLLATLSRVLPVVEHDDVEVGGDDPRRPVVAVSRRLADALAGVDPTRH